MVRFLILFSLSAIFATPHIAGVFYGQPYVFNFVESEQSYKGKALINPKEQWWHFAQDDAYDLWLTVDEVKLIDYELKQIHIYSWDEFEQRNELLSYFRKFWFSDEPLESTFSPQIVKQDGLITLTWTNDQQILSLNLEQARDASFEFEPFSIPLDFKFIKSN